jgi:histidine triad (HIT) family protein
MTFELPVRDPCPFCENVAGRRDCARLYETGITLGFVNPRQFERGATIVIPKRHCDTLLDLTDDEAVDVIRGVRLVARAIGEAFAPRGLNVFQNNGLAAGQSVPHVHFHVVPRHGDVPAERVFTSADTRITSLDEREIVAELIRQALRGAPSSL